MLSATLKKALSCALLALLTTSSAYATTVERLSLFLYDGTNAYEDRRIGSPQNNLPSTVTAQFTTTPNAQNEYTWEWKLTNTSGAALNNLRATVLVDVDINPEDNTFHNEHGELIQLTAPIDHIAADQWEISELGYRHGDLLQRATTGNLNNQTDQNAATADDTAMALSLNIGTLENDQELTITATLTDNGTVGLRQKDAHNNNQTVYQAYAKLGPITPRAMETVDYAITKTTSTPTVNVGESVEYTITITNNGQESGSGVTLTDTVPSTINNVTWACAANGTASCGTASGSGNTINLNGQVPTGAGNSLTITVSGTAVTAGTITNTATIAATTSSDTTDNNAANNQSSATIAIAATATSADLTIVKTTTTPNITVNDAIAYQLTITNAGPNAVTGATITDTVPNAITNVDWTCTPSSGVACNTTGGNGNTIQLTENIPVGETITIDISGEAASAGTITNTAFVSSTINDPDTTNNQDSVDIIAAAVPLAGTPPHPIPTNTSIALIAFMLLLAGGIAVRIRKTRRLPLLCALILAVCLSANETYAQVPDNRGTDFWIGFPLNHSGANNLVLFIASDVDGKAIIEIPGISYREEMDFIEGTLSSVQIPKDVQYAANDRISQFGIHVTASAPITLYGLSQEQYTTDAFLALPTSNLGKEYFVASYSGSFAGSQLMVVGVENDSTVTITPTSKSLTREAGQPFTINLQEGETYRLVADGVHGDLTGSHIQSDKPIAVLSGHLCTQIPAGRSACDFIVEQLPPVSSWGKQFITVPLASRRNGDTFRVVAADDETPIYINNSHVITLQEGQYYELILTAPSLIESDKSILLAQYSNSQGFDNTQADPFMMLVTPVGQYLSHYIVSTPADGISKNYINIVIPESSRDSLTLDGKKVESTFSALEGTRYQTTQIAVDPGQHTIEANVPFGAYIYGFDNWDSYGYPAGTALRNLDVSFQPLSCLTGIKARAKPNSVQLTWADTGAEKYAVYRAESYLGTYTKVGETRSLYSTFLDKENLTEKQNYFYRIDELDENDEVQCSSSPIAAYVPETITFGTQINRAPYFVSTPESNALLRIAYQYQIAVIDPDNDPVTYQLLAAPTGASVDNEGKFSWLPDAVGRFTASVQVLDASGAVAVQSFEILVRDPNRPPVITSDPVLEADAGLPYIYKVIADDPDGDEITYSIISNATGLKIDSKTGLISWDVFSTASGQYPVKVFAKDPYGALAQQIFLINVTPNKAPVATSAPVYKAARGIPYQYQIVAYDPEGEALAFSFEQEPPNGMIIDTATGLISWDSPSLGTHNIRVIISDGVIKTIHAYSLVVSLFEENRPPQITSVPTVRITAGQTYTYNVSASDPDGETVTLALKKNPAAMALTDRQIQWVTTTADIGAHEIELEASDPRGGVATQTWALEVVPASSNRAPRINSIPTTTGTAGITYTYQVSASDQDNDPLTYALETAPLDMTISESGKVEWTIPDGTSGVFTVEIKVSDDKGAYALQQYKIGVGLPTNRPPRIYSQPTTAQSSGTNYAYQLNATDPDGDSPLVYRLITAPDDMTISTSGRIEWSIPATTTGSVAVEIEVSDGRGGFARQQYTIAIDASSNNRPPLITSQPVVATASGADYIYKVTATDADSDPITFTLINAPEDMTISESSEIAWKVPDDLIGIVEVEIKADDGKGGVATQGYPISVADAGNRPPRINSTPATTATIGTLYTYQVSASDQDNDPLTYALTGKPDGMTISDTGKVEWTPEVAQNGYHHIEVTVSDGKGGTAVQTYTLYAQLANNSPPRITSLPVYQTRPGVAYEYKVVAYDANSDVLTYSLAESPAGMTISTEGIVYWGDPIAGKYDITVVVSDPHGAYASQSYVLSVGENGVPQITSQPTLSAIIGELYRYEVDAIDPDGDFLTYQLVTKPSNMTISSDGVIEWTPTAKGSVNVTIRISDGQDTDEQSYTIVVKDASAVIDSAKAVSWIQAQQKANGSYMYSSTIDLASPEGSTSESLTAFRMLSVSSSAAQDQAYAFLQSGDGESTEEISRRIIASVEQGAVNNALVIKLKTYQNDDGGFGTYQGYASHAYETAWALKALVMAEQQGDTQTQGALSWLLNQQQTTGNWLNHSDGDNFALTAHALDTSWLYSRFYIVQNNLDKAQQWLMSQQSSGQWGSNYKNAIGLRAVAPGLSDISSVQIVVDALLITQGTYGGWDYDVHQTALILQALYKASLL